MLDYALKNQDIDVNKYIYNKVVEKPSITNQTMIDFMNRKDSAIEKALEK